MKFVAYAKKISASPFKLRPLVDVIRGKDVKFALGWLATCNMKKAEPIKKVVESAAANAKNRGDVAKEDLFISEIKVDQGPTFKYYKPGAMGRGNVFRKRFSHISVTVQGRKEKAEEV